MLQSVGERDDFVALVKQLLGDILTGIAKSAGDGMYSERVHNITKTFGRQKDCVRRMEDRKIIDNDSINSWL
jgi:hypothetical protein